MSQGAHGGQLGVSGALFVWHRVSYVSLQGISFMRADIFPVYTVAQLLIRGHFGSMYQGLRVAWLMGIFDRGLAYVLVRR